MKKNIGFLLWAVCLTAFLLLMGNLYCRMMYGGGIFYVMTRQNEITEEDREYLKGRGSLVYGETLDSFPAQLYEESLNGEGGFAIDLMNQLSLEMGTSIEFYPLLWPDVFDSLESGQVDMIQISYSPEREEEYCLTAPIYESKGVVFLRNDSPKADRLEGLQGRKVAGIKEDYAMLVLKRKMPDLEIQEYDSIDQCAQVLKDGLVDGIVADEQNIMYYAQQEKMYQDYYIMEEEVYREGVVFAVRKTDQELGHILDKAVYKLRSSDVLDKIQQKWFLKSILDHAVSDEQIYTWTVECTLGIIALAVLMFWYIHDNTKKLVTERTRELEEERKRLETILDSIPQYLVEIDGRGNIRTVKRGLSETGWETALGSFLGLEQGEAGSMEAGSREIGSREISDMIQEARQCGFLQRDMEFKRKWFRITLSSMRGKNEDGDVIMIMEDITLHHVQERQNMQNYKMAAIGQLASGISHELKNPLEIICNYCYAIRKGILKSEDQIQHTVDIIENEAKSANKIVDSLLSFARVTPEEVGETELKTCIRSLLEFQMPILQKKDIQVQFECPDNVLVKCNPEAVKRMLVNLMTNAVDAMPGGGQIHIKVRRGTDTVQLEFGDTGSGMEENELEQIFNPFYTTKSTGTGLGLYLVYHQVEEWGGTIQADSRPGEGTVFRISFQGPDI